MARYERLEVLNTLLGDGLVPIFFNDDPKVAERIALACQDGGVRAIEFTNRGDFAPEIFRKLSESLGKTAPNLMLGVGTILDAPTAAIFLAYGANFVVGPIFNEAVAKLCNRRKIAYIPGCASVTEISRAEEYGVEIVKIFPGGSIGGPDFVRSVLGPCPWSLLMPTGGIDISRECIESWFDAGVACVGIGSHLIPKASIQQGDFEIISQNVSKVLEWIRICRS